MKTKSSRHALAGAPGTVRIIGGTLRGSRLAVPDIAGLRPTPGRVRETLFNWLAPVIDGARCLDLFAGTGALGIEALSRGARHVDFVESDATVAQRLRANLQRLHVDVSARVHHASAETFLARPTEAPYDIVFLDPPFGANLWSSIVARIETLGRLAPDALIYVEAPLDAHFEPPHIWHPQRAAVAGQVRYALFKRSAKLD